MVESSVSSEYSDSAESDDNGLNDEERLLQRTIMKNLVSIGFKNLRINRNTISSDRPS